MFPNINTLPYLSQYFNFLEKEIKHNGIIHCVKILKQVRLHITRYICGNPLYTNDLFIGLDKDGWPKRLFKLKELVNNSIESRKFLLTIVLLPRTLKLNNKEKSKLKPDYDSITKPSGKNIKIIPTGFIKEFVKLNKLKLSENKFDKSSIYLSTKAGPSGLATLTSLKSIVNLSSQEISWLGNLTDTNGLKYLKDMQEKAWSSIKLRILQKDFSVGRLSFIYDPECKLRIVAIVDYFSQLFLKPIHNKILKKLRNFKQDRTFTQDPFNNWDYNNNHNFYSLDLSSATDRFPIILQKRLIREMYDSEILANSWMNLLKNRNFLTRENNYINYAVGQPMGSYSSWAAFTLSHHLLVHWCAKLEGVSNFNQYILLGDDIVIKHNEIAKRYIKWCNYLDVKISMNKTHVSKDTYEFAKRWITNDNEVTGLPMNGIINNIKNPFIVITFLYSYFKIKNNRYLVKFDLSDLLTNFYSEYIKLGSRFLHKNYIKRLTPFKSKHFKNKLELYTLGLDYRFGYFNYDRYRSIIIKYLNSDLYQIPPSNVIHEEIHSIILKGTKVLGSKYMENLDNYIKILKTKYVEYFNLKDVNELKDNPIFLSILNHADSLNNKFYELGFDSPIKLIDELISLDLNNLLTNRNKILEVVSYGKVFLNGCKELKKSLTTESEFSKENFENIQALYGKVQGNLEKTLMDLRSIEKGTYREMKLKSFNFSMSF